MPELDTFPILLPKKPATNPTHRLVHTETTSMSRLFWTWVRLEAWLYSRAMNAHLRLAAFYGATIPTKGLTRL